MKPDQLRIVVRPRTILECLDLACVFAVRRAPGIVLALLVGVLPIALINVLLIGPDAAAELVPSWPFWLAIETPWAMAPLTLYLGRAMFSDRLGAADWRAIARAMGGGAISLVLYQTVLRGLAMLLILPFPFLMVAMAFVDPVILLERVPLRGVWRRSLALVGRGVGRILLAVSLEMPILLVGWCLIGVGLDQLASLWAGRPVMEVFDDSPDWNMGYFLFTWSGQIACWSMMALLTVFRFVVYLDTRIRNEGWDVELKLRNPATYAGLERWRGAAVLLLVVTLLSLPTAEAMPLSSSTPAPIAAEREAGGDAARGAVVRQRFPWYDAGTDAYRPVVGDGELGSEIDFPSWSLSLPTLGTLVKAAMILLLLVVVGAVAWVLLSRGYEASVPDEPDRTGEKVLFGDEHLETLPEQARGDVDTLLPQIESRLAAGDHAAAAILYHAWQLVELHAGGVIELAKGKTNRRYAAEVGTRAPALAELFRDTTRLSEQARFGRLKVSAEAFAAVWEQRQRVTAIEAEAIP
jgi:hypothetical protein